MRVLPKTHQVPDGLLGEGGCTGRLTQQVHENGVAQQQRETHKRPGQEWCLEGEEAEEVDSHLGVAAAPYIHQHDCECLAQEEQAAQEPQQLSQSQGAGGPLLVRASELLPRAPLTC